VTHDLNEIPFLADRLTVIMEGEIAQTGPVNHVLSHPDNVHVAEFLGVANIWPGRIKDAEKGRYTVTPAADEGLILEVYTGRDEVYSPGKCIAACIRPEYLTVTTEKDKYVPEPNSLKGKIVEVYPFGYSYRLKIESAAGRDLKLVALVPAAQFLKPPKPGDAAAVYIPPEKIHIIQD
jgi:ABC-type Fe3+/spermidine/putrescine transport system ATPase subunit